MKQFLRSLLIIVVLLGLMAPSLAVSAQKPEFISNQYTQLDTVNTNWTNYQDIPDTYELVGENTNFKLYVDKATLGFKVVDKRSGYVWHSTLDKTEKGDRLNKSWLAFAQSGISIDYLDLKAVVKRISVTNSKTTIDVRTIDQGFEGTVAF